MVVVENKEKIGTRARHVLIYVFRKFPSNSNGYLRLVALPPSTISGVHLIITTIPP